MAGVLVYIEQVGGDVATISRELMGKGRELAHALGGSLSALVVSDNPGALAERAIILGADTVYMLADPGLASYTTDGYVAAAKVAVATAQPALILAGSSSRCAILVLPWPLISMLVWPLISPI